MTNHNTHWADNVARKIINLKDKDVIHLAGGITPSGSIHVGNFREIITVDLVKRALLRQGKKVKFFFFWDDYDVLRKVPKNMPKQDYLEKCLGMPISSIEDPHGKERSYARFHEIQIENLLGDVNIEVDYIYQSDKYRQGFYRDEIKQALNKRQEIKEILNQYRRENLLDDWYPITLYCDKCQYNRVKILSVNNDNNLIYHCEKCNTKYEFNHQEKFITKLLWRIDWPMRWAKMQIDFEPGGKDHSTQGGSYDTAKEIVEKVFDNTPPIFLQYDFIRIKGKGGKISSSDGEVITLSDLLEIYEPEIIRWLFASYQPNVEFVISFDLDVLNIYESYDRAERIYFNKEEVSDKKRKKVERIYELAQLDINFVDSHPSAPYRISFRHLANLLQINESNVERTYQHYQDRLTVSQDSVKFKNRLRCVKNWLQKYAPEDFIFQINRERNRLEDLSYEENYWRALGKFRSQMEAEDALSEERITEQIYKLIKDYELDNKTFFSLFYRLIIDRDNGPRLANFIVNVGKEKILKLI